MDLYSLICNSQRGDKQATEDLLLNFSDTIKNLSKNINYEEAETDLIISLLELLEEMNIDNFRDKDNKQIAKFIHTFLRNKSVDLFRKYVVKQKFTVEIDHDLLSDSSNIDFNSNIFISELLKDLPTHQREIIIKKYIYEFSDKEIAKQLKVSRQAINRTKNRGLKNLRNSLKQNGKI